jgi:hypothetical protein
MILLRGGKLVKIDTSEDCNVFITAVKTVDILKQEQPYQADKIMRDKIYTLTYDCDKNKYIFILSQTPYGEDPYSKKYDVGRSGNGFYHTKGEAIAKMLEINPTWNPNQYDIYLIKGEEKTKIVL